MMAVGTRGWQVGRSLLDCHKYMLENHVACDVTFLFPTSGGSSVTVPAHSYMLRCRSPVFEAMLSGNFKEKFDDISIVDLEADNFKEVLRYMYFDEVSLSGNNVLQILFAAKKYLLEGLVSRCQKFLEEEMCEDNACTILSHCLSYDEQKLADECVEFVTSRVDKILQSKDFLELSKDGLHMLLSNDDLAPNSEEDVFIACMKWAEKHKQDETSTLRETLGNCLHQIRYCDIESEVLLELTCKYQDVISNDELIWILRKMLIKEKVQIPVYMKEFNLDKRNIGKWNVEIRATPNRFEYMSDWPIINVRNESLLFETDEPIHFMGVTLFGGMQEGAKHNVNLKIYDCGKLLQNFSGEIITERYNQLIPFRTYKPCWLDAGVLYQIQVSLDGPSTFYGYRRLGSVMEAGVTFSFLSLPDAYGDTTDKAGQIPQLLFTL